jgi:hypothetical protein
MATTKTKTTKNRNAKKVDGRTTRGPRNFTSEQRAEIMAAKGADTAPSRDSQLTNYGLLKKVWTGRGEIVASVKGIPVAIARSDLIRQLKALPADGKAVLDIKDGTGDLEGLRVLA